MPDQWDLLRQLYQRRSIGARAGAFEPSPGQPVPPVIGGKQAEPTPPNPWDLKNVRDRLEGTTFPAMYTPPAAVETPVASSPGRYWDFLNWRGQQQNERINALLQQMFERMRVMQEKNLGALTGNWVDRLSRYRNG